MQVICSLYSIYIMKILGFLGKLMWVFLFWAEKTKETSQTLGSPDSDR